MLYSRIFWCPNERTKYARPDTSCCQALIVQFAKSVYIKCEIHNRSFILGNPFASISTEHQNRRRCISHSFALGCGAVRDPRQALLHLRPPVPYRLEDSWHIACLHQPQALQKLIISIGIRTGKNWGLKPKNSQSCSMPLGPKIKLLWLNMPCHDH